MSQDFFDLPEDEGKRKKKKLKLPEIAIGAAFGCVGAAGLAYFVWTQTQQAPIWTSEAQYAAPFGAPGAAPGAGGEGEASQTASIPPPRTGYGPVGVVTPYAGVVVPTSAGGAPEQCPQVEAVFAAIAEATQGVAIADIVAALAALESDPQGVVSGAQPNALAQRLRGSLSLSGQATPCGTTMAGLSEALRLARLAAADADVTTAAIGETVPPTAFNEIPTGGGAEGSGYGN